MYPHSSLHKIIRLLLNEECLLELIYKGGIFMNTKKCHDCGCSKPSSDPSSPKYAEDTNNKAHSKSPFGSDEPSTHTTYK